MISPIINTKNYILRPFEKGDISLWQKWDVDEEVQAFMPEPKNEPVTVGEQERFLVECAEDPDGYYWSIQSLDGTTIGTVSLTEIQRHHQTASLGIVIGDKNYWGKGAATEVVAGVVSHAFSHLSIEYVCAEVEIQNAAMAKVFAKAGFNQDGIFEGARVKNGKRIDVLHFSVRKNTVGE